VYFLIQVLIIVELYAKGYRVIKSRNNYMKVAMIRRIYHKNTEQHIKHLKNVGLNLRKWSGNMQLLITYNIKDRD